MAKEFIKDFDGWNELKKNLDESKKFPSISEGEVWWCSVGVNVGVEICGKGRDYSRPVLVLKKLSKYGFVGIPLTSKPKDGVWYVNFEFLGVTEAAAICQARVMSVFRLYNRMGRITKSDLQKVKEGLCNLWMK